MKDFGFIEACLILLVVWGVVELIMGFWQILVVLAIIGGVCYVVMISGKKSSPEYEVRSAPPKLPPLPFSEPTPDVVQKSVETQKKIPPLTEAGSDRIFYIAERAEAEGWREMYDDFYELSDLIRNSHDIKIKLAACEASFKILPRFVEAQLEVFGELPKTILCRDKAPKLYLRLGQWDKAREAILKCISAGAMNEVDGRNALEYVEKYEHAARVALEFIRNNDGFLQRKIYDALPEVDRDCLKDFVRSSLLIRKEPDGNTNKIYAL